MPPVCKREITGEGVEIAILPGLQDPEKKSSTLEQFQILHKNRKFLQQMTAVEKRMNNDLGFSK